jgi:hypothetical protein
LFFFVAKTGSPGIIVVLRSDPRADEDAIVARPRGTTAEKLHVVADATREPALPASSTPDPRLVNLVRLLARQAARDFVQAETDGRKHDRLPE